MNIASSAGAQNLKSRRRVERITMARLKEAVDRGVEYFWKRRPERVRPKKGLFHE